MARQSGECQLDDLAGGCSGDPGSRAASSLSSDAEGVWGKEPPHLLKLAFLEHLDIALQQMLSR